MALSELDGCSPPPAGSAHLSTGHCGQLGAKLGHLPAEDRNSVPSLRLSAEPSPLTFLPLDRNLQPWRDPMQCVGSVGKRGW